MPEELLVRRAGLADAAILSGLRWEWDVLEAVKPALTRAEYDSRFAEWMRANADTHLPFLAVTDDEPVGMAWLALLSRVPAASLPHRVGGDVQSVFVVPHLRGQGAGRKLIGAVTREAARLGLPHLTVRSGPKPLGFYLRLGFAANTHTLELTP